MTRISVTITDLAPGDRVRCYDTFDGTVVRVVDNFLGRFVIVDHDSDFVGQTSVHQDYVQSI